MNSYLEKLEGKSIVLQKEITRKDTYDNLLSTASLTRLMLDTGWMLIEQELPEGVSSYTSMIQVNHEEPTPAGETITVEAVIKKREENKVFISLKALDETSVIAHGLNERHILDKNSINLLAKKRSEAIKQHS